MPLNNFGICGSLGRCAQPDADGFAVARDLGYNHILKLNTEEDFPVHLEAAYFAPGNIWHAPMNSLKPSEREAQGLIEEIQLLPPTSKLLIHCTLGRDRTGFVCGAWRVLVEKWTADDAWKEMQQFGWTFYSSLMDKAIYGLLKKLEGT